VTLNPGESTFVDLFWVTMGVAFGQRAEVRPVVTLLPGPNAGTASVQATVELYDILTDRTWAVFIPAPDPQ
jgi:hypothetical protein